jgi:CRISPR/Cas system CMR subunit Cmr4 (Cas7 group RAMP superfamily)
VKRKLQHKTVKATIRFLVLVMFLIPVPGTTDVALVTLGGVVLLWVAIEIFIEWLLTAMEVGLELLVKIIKRRRH